ncbi:hypothetical protein GmHk_17G049492 [Glycine max]|nr:hypothetical protein GmHk_17G049492 [Glycine max]
MTRGKTQKVKSKSHSQSEKDKLCGLPNVVLKKHVVNTKKGLGKFLPNLMLHSINFNNHIHFFEFFFGLCLVMMEIIIPCIHFIFITLIILTRYYDKSQGLFMCHNIQQLSLCLIHQYFFRLSLHLDSVTILADENDHANPFFKL